MLELKTKVPKEIERDLANRVQETISMSEYFIKERTR